MSKTIKLELSLGEYEHIVTTLEGCLTEFEVLMSDVSWFTSESVERIETALLILENRQDE